MNKNILALDISTKSTGVAIYNKTNLIHYQCITASSDNIFNRIDKITDRLEELVKQYQIGAVVVEAPLPDDVGHNLSVYKKLTWAQGIIGDMLNKYKLTFDRLYIPSQWRKLVGIKTGRYKHRNELKQQAIDKVYKMFNAKVNDDVADAILIGLAYTAYEQTEEGAF